MSDWAPKTILLVDDEAAVRQLLERVLREAGYIVVAAKDGVEALQLASEQSTIDLLVTDVVMRGPKGGEVAEQLRALRPGLPVIFISTFRPSRVGAHRHKPEFFLEKPFAPHDLLDLVREVLHNPSPPQE